MRNRVVYKVTTSGGQIQFDFHGVIDQDEPMLLDPGVAVSVLRKHPELTVYVEITQHVQDVMFKLWETAVEVEASSPIERLRQIYMDNAGEFVFVERDLISDVLDQVFNESDGFSKYLLPYERLTPTESRIFTRLMRIPGHPVPPTVLLVDIKMGSADTLWVHVHRLRAKLDPRAASLNTVRGVGYYIELVGKTIGSVVLPRMEESC